MSAGSRASVSAVVAAAGSGERLGAGGPKAFVPLAGRPMVEWSLAALRGCEAVERIVVACPPGHGSGGAPWGDAGRGGADVAGDLRLVDGGSTRSQSVSNALAAVDTDLVAIHDAARPLLTAELVEAVIVTLLNEPEADGAIAATPVVDTIKRLGASASPAEEETRAAFGPSGGPNAPLAIESTLDRGRLWAAQTPQAFRTEALRRALDAHPAEAAPATDEAMLLEAAGGRVLIHPAPAENIKVTTPLDLELAEFVLAERRAGGSSPPGNR